MAILATILNFQKLLFFSCDMKMFCFNRFSKGKAEIFLAKKAKIRSIKVKTIYLLSRTYCSNRSLDKRKCRSQYPDIYSFCLHMFSNNNSCKLNVFPAFTNLSHPYLVDTCLRCIGRGPIDRKLCNQSLGKIPLTSENYLTKV